jgi:GNAT superfamily N-acetyltransferase
MVQLTQDRDTYYPLRVALEDGTPVTLRSLAPTDAEALLRHYAPSAEAGDTEDGFAPPADRAQFGGAGAEVVPPLLALAEGRIVGEATLDRGPAGASADAARARLRLDPDYRERGLGSVLLRELRAIAFDLELDRLVLELDGPPDLRDTARRLGFREVAGHAGDGIRRSGGPTPLELQPGNWALCAPPEAATFADLRFAAATHGSPARLPLAALR